MILISKRYWWFFHYAFKCPIILKLYLWVSYNSRNYACKISHQSYAGTLGSDLLKSTDYNYWYKLRDTPLMTWWLASYNVVCKIFYFITCLCMIVTMQSWSSMICMAMFNTWVLLSLYLLLPCRLKVQALTSIFLHSRPSCMAKFMQ